MLDKIKNWLTMIAAAVGVLTVIGGVAYQAGWVVRRADAETMITEMVQAAATQAAQSVLDEAKARETADLLLQKSLLVGEIKRLLDLPHRTAGQEYDLAELQKNVDRINARLDALK